MTDHSIRLGFTSSLPPTLTKQHKYTGIDIKKAAVCNGTLIMMPRHCAAKGPHLDGARVKAMSHKYKSTQH